MKCHEAKRRLDLFMDGELAVPENLSVLEHLNLCRPCADVFEGEKRLRTSMKARLGALRAPAGLAARLSASLGGGEVAAFPSRRGGMIAAAAIFFAIVGSLLFSEGPGVQLLASELSERHGRREAYACGEGGDERRCLCPACTTDVAPAIRSFFEKHAERDYCAHVAEASKVGYAYEGVAAWRCRGGDEVFWSSWRTSNGSRVSHALVALALDAPRAERKAGRVVLFYPRSPELACVFVFDDAAEAGRFTSALGLPKP
ncbi:MAG TPA: zf-HC2 domain-containing protein [Planctomycetota bacterium]